MKLKTIALFSLLFLAIFHSCNKHKDNQISPAPTESKASKNHRLNASNYECATLDSFPNQDFEKIALKQKSLLTSSPYCINVQFHIVRETGGSGGFNSANIATIIQNLNFIFNRHEMFFYSAGVDYIDNSAYYKLDYGTSDLNNLVGTNNNANALNMYIVDSLHHGSSSPSGLAVQIPGRNLILIQDVALLSTPAHEIGHCLNLYHTHRGSGCDEFSGACAEASDGSNCNTCGDYICDTPPDPCLSGNVLGPCLYNGPGGYFPLTNNIMSYSLQQCRTRYTAGQVTRMTAALDWSSDLEPVKKSTCITPPTISGASDVCKATVFTLNNLPSGATVVWGVDRAGAVTFSSQTSNTITVTQVEGETGYVELQAAITSGGTTIYAYKTVYLPIPKAPKITLNPASSSCLTWNTERNFAAGYTTTGPWKDINLHPEAAEVDWQVYDYSTNPATMITSFTKTNSTVLGNSIYLWLHSNSSPYVMEIVCRAKDKCGNWNTWGPGHAYFIRQSCTSFMAMDVSYDSKANGYNVNFSSDYNKLRSILETNKNRHAKMTNDFDMSIYNTKGDRVFFKEKSTNPRTFLRGLTPGDYKIVILQDGNSYEQTLSVK